MLITKEYLDYFFHSYKSTNRYIENVSESKRMQRINSRDDAFELIKDRNNNEPESIYSHRKKNLRMITYAGFDQIFNTLSVIGNSNDFTIHFPSAPTLIANVAPDSYFNNLPIYGSLRNWLFNFVMRDMMFEPNGGILTTYNNIESDSVLPEPIFLHYKAEDVCNYVHNEVVILRICDGENEYLHSFLVVDRVGYYTYALDDSTAEYRLVNETLHNLGVLPFVLFGGFAKEMSVECEYRSFLSGVCEYWSEALSLNSDLQAVFKNSAFPVKMIVTNDECIGCSESERAEFEREKKNGRVSFAFQDNTTTTKSPYTTLTTPPAKNGEPNPLFPFVAFASPDSSIIETLKAQVKTCMDSGFAAVCMQHLSEVGANQSGLAKEYDRSHLNSFLFKIASHIKENILKPCVSFALNIRYGNVSGLGREAIVLLQPIVKIPTRFDTLSAQLLENQILQSKNSGIYSGTVRQMQIDLIKKQYENEPLVCNKLIAQIELDTLSNYSTTELTQLNSIGAIQPDDLILHSNIERFILQACAEDSGFYNLPYTEKRALADKFISDYKTANVL